MQFNQQPTQVDREVRAIDSEHNNNVPEDAWYWNPQSEEFKSGKPEYAKVKPLDLMTFGYMHKLGKCRTMRAKAHAKAKENPALISLLVPLPKGTKDCITIAGGG